ncbi:hypothetical protein GCM10011506_44290 [Marivirga lumbricoides]|uniref:Pre-toxin TG domain-containing protein n=1 Tax=Marivirga lumbricoides TaxID=1046115 RepID=A0ABQ1N4Y0_9BACT|nr:hypothetical protein GCM10011506_44290 [Marivirga lumbricoides]
MHSSYDQYVAQYGTESAFYLGEKYMTMMGLIYSLHALGVGTNMATNSLKVIPAYSQRMRLYNSRAKLVETQVRARMSETFLARYPNIRNALTSSRSEVGSNAKMYELDNFIRRLSQNELTRLEGNPKLVTKLAQDYAKDPRLIANFKAVRGSYEEWVLKAEGEVAKRGRQLTLGKFEKKIGDYEVYEQGEVFFRGMTDSDFEYLIANNKLKVTSNTSEMFTSPSLEYIKSVGYGVEGVIVKIQVKPGTLDALAAKGIRDQSSRAAYLYPDIPNPQKPAGWIERGGVYFKQETTKNTNSKQVNIDLGRIRP